MIHKMIVANLAHRPLRSLISIVAVALEVTLILLIVGFALGMLNDTRTRQKGIGADVIVLPPGSTNLLAVSGAPIPVKVDNLIAKLDHVRAVTPVIMQMALQASGAPELIYGIDLPSYESMGAKFRYLEGGPYEGPYDVIVDDFFAHSSHVKVGSNIEILNHTFRVCGIVEHGKGARKFLPLSTLQEITGSRDKASAFYVKLDDAANADAVVGAVKAIPGMETYNVRSMRDYLSMLTPDNIPALAIFIKIVIGISVTIGFIVIFQAMYTAVMERTREIGILKSMGASKAYIIALILRETTALAVAGIVLGTVLSLAAGAVIHYRAPILPMDVTLGWIGNTTLIAIVGALTGAFYPALKAAGKDPIEALAYE
jgi:putative ABC transport system permease protein